MHCFKSQFHKSKKAKIQRLRNNIFTKLSSFFRLSTKSFGHSFFYIFDKTCNGAKHVSVFLTGRRGLAKRDAQMLVLFLCFENW